MAVAPVSPNGTGSASAVASTISFTRPAGWVSGTQAEVVVVVKGGSGVLVPPTGTATFTQVNRTDHGTNFAVILYKRTLGGSEPAAYTWSITTGGGGATSKEHVVVGSAFTGVHATTPTDGGGSGQANPSGVNCVAPSITPSIGTPYEFVLWAAGINRGFAGASGNVTPPAGYTLLVDARSGTGSSNLGAALAYKATTAATGTATGVWSLGANNVGQHLGLVGVGHNLTGLIQGVAAVGGDLSVGHPLVGSVAGASAVGADAGAPTVGHPLAGSVAGVSAISGTLTNAQAPWTATVAGVSAVSGALTVQFGRIVHGLAGAVAGTSAVSATGPTMDLALAGAAAGVSAVSGDLSLSSPTLAPSRGVTGWAGGRGVTGGSARRGQTGGRRD